MLLESLSLTNFRNYSKADFTFSPSTTLVVGPNTSGKTNLLEAIYFLATGKSFRAGYDREVIRIGKGVAHIEGVLASGGTLSVSVATTASSGNGSHKRFKTNGVGKRLSDFAGSLRAVYFGPEEILLVTGSPSRRRKYLDSVLTQVSREYARALSEYEKVVRQRNRLLLLIREGEQSRSQLDFWDGKLVTLGSRLTAGRRELFEYFNPSATLRAGNLFLEYQPKVVSNEVLERGREQEIAAGMTLYGPHRDDFGFVKPAPLGPRELHSGNPCAFINNSGANPNVPLAGPSVASRGLAAFGSRGEQRLAVLRLKLAELEFIAERAGDRPILLLDDIFSELDEDNRSRVLRLLDKQQTIITTTDLDQIDGEKLKQHKVLRLQ